MNRRAHRLATIVALSATAGCSLIVSPSENPTRCVRGGACGDGLVCVDYDGEGVGFCREPTGTLECTNDDGCQGLEPPRPHCRIDVGCVECLEDAHCELGRLCNTDPNDAEPDNRCVPGCTELHGCAEGLVCFEGRCRQSQPEACNGEDDDLDGMVDEEFDTDGDGHSACAFVSLPPDCDDTTSAAFPGGEEACDAIDNDCDGQVDDGACDEGWVCNPPDGCIQVDQPCYEPGGSCEPEAFCNPGTGICEPPATFGGRCFQNAQCPAGMQCINTNPVGYPGDFCTEFCCSHDDCPAGGWCADRGNGFKVCAPAEWFGSATQTCNTGPLGLGSRDCKTCAFNARNWQFFCRETCCRDSDCQDDECQLVVGTNAITGPVDSVDDLIRLTETAVDLTACNLFMSDGLGRYETGPCTDIFCRTGLALSVGDYCECTSVCCADTDCRDDGHAEAHCTVFNGHAICMDDPATPTGSKAFGVDGCGGGDFWDGWEQCETAVCHPGDYCTRTCCPGESCPTGYDCLPTLISGRYVSLCTRE